MAKRLGTGVEKRANTQIGGGESLEEVHTRIELRKVLGNLRKGLKRAVGKRLNLEGPELQEVVGQHVWRNCVSPVEVEEEKLPERESFVRARNNKSLWNEMQLAPTVEMRTKRKEERIHGQENALSTLGRRKVIRPGFWQQTCNWQPLKNRRGARRSITATPAATK